MREIMKKVALIGAFDRYNYGDILFPIILENLFSKMNIKCINVGLVSNDLTDRGGVKCISYRDFFDDGFVNSVDAIIIVGGEVFSPNWTDMYCCLDKTKYPTLLIRVLRKLGFVKSLDVLCRKEITSSNMLLPWVINNREYDKGIKIIYNSVGGSSIEKLRSELKKYLIDNLNSSTFLSLRDNESIAQLETNGLNRGKAISSPDSAVVMSDVFEEKLSKIDLPNRIQNKKYFVFQINNYLAKTSYDRYAKYLDIISEKNNIIPVLLPIGTAKMHDDDIALSNISKRMKKDHILINDPNILLQMKLIANSQLYIGTSLHGAITALSFSVPHVGLTRKVKKLEEFFSTWGVTNYSKCMDIEEINNFYDEIVSINKGLLIRKSNELKALYYEQFEMMSKEII
jgi:hypothetical protein